MRNWTVLLAIVVIPTSAWAGSKEIPSWVQEVSSQRVPSYSGEVPAVVLLDERHVIFEPSGTLTISSRCAIKVLTHDGAKDASADEYYFRNGRKVTRFQGWLVAPSGFTKTYDKNAVDDIGLFDTLELYSDLRVRSIHVQNAEIGAVFAYESEVQEHALFAQDEFSFQSSLPSVHSRYILTVPQGWSAKGIVFNHEPVEPVVDGSNYVWELKGLPFHREEEGGPGWHGLTPRLAVSIVAPSGAQAAGCFKSWADVSKWHSTLAAGQDEVTPEIAAKVHELTANAAGHIDKIRAISRYVQGLKYVAIEMNLARGGGYKPHAAAVVFRNGYGDCKDKANLMHTMLKAAGIESYLVAISATDRTYVREEWPAPAQFNHMIVAVRAPDGVDLPTVISAPDLGRLLIFDATSETTPLGDLPEREQGSFALLCAGARGGIAKMPVTAPEANTSDVTLTGTLSELGDLSASITDTLHGQFADAERFRQLRESPDEYRNFMQERLYQSAKGVTLKKLDKDDSFSTNVLRLKLEFASNRFGQLMQQRLLVFTPSISMPSIPRFPAESERHEPVLLHAACRRKHIRIKLPTGFMVDELPQPAQIDANFAHFSLKYAQKPDELDMDEELKTEAATIPASDYKKVKEFFDHCNGADSQQAVLVKN